MPGVSLTKRSIASELARSSALTREPDAGRCYVPTARGRAPNLRSLFLAHSNAAPIRPTSRPPPLGAHNAHSGGRCLLCAVSKYRQRPPLSPHAQGMTVPPLSFGVSNTTFCHRTSGLSCTHTYSETAPCRNLVRYLEPPHALLRNRAYTVRLHGGSTRILSANISNVVTGSRPTG